MRLAHAIVIKLGVEDIELRPRLRFAIQLERRSGGFSQLVTDINDGSLTAALDIIAPHTGMPFLAPRIHHVLPKLHGPLLAYVSACAGIDPDDKQAKTDEHRTPKSVPFSEYLLGLYRIGTGWLGWTPSATLDATPFEIIEAHKGRTEMLKAILGGGEPAEPKDDRPLDEKFRSIFAGHQIIREEG